MKTVITHQGRILILQAALDVVTAEVERLREELVSKKNFADTAVRVAQMWEKKAEAADQRYIDEAVHSNELSDKLDAAEAELDRYREALEQITTCRFPMPTPCRETYLRNIARAALEVKP